jgi:anthranilate phosphoribosyltransferase
MLAGQASPVQAAGFLVALRAKGETPAEVAAMLQAVRGAGIDVPLPDALRLAAVDVVGTGGDGTSSVNISTMASLVVAGAGVPVCKHGNRASSSSCGAADVLEALGVVLELAPEDVGRCVVEAGIGFCFAPRFHPAFRHVGPTRRELGVPTVFNMLGPLANPAGVTRLLVGAASPRVASLLAEALATAEVQRAWVVHGPDGLDELSTGGTTQVWCVEGGSIERRLLDPEGLGLVAASLDDLRGGDPAHNATLARAVLQGEPGPRRDVVVLNAAAALVVAGVCDDLGQGVELAQRSLDEGRAHEALQRLIAVSRARAPAGPPG